MDKELILKKIESCREAWQTARTFVPGRNSRTAIYTYLAIVFALYQELRDSKGAKRAAAFLIRKFNLQLNKQSHPLAALIAASCREEKKAQSRYVRCLRYARAHRNLWLHQTLEDFLQANGGVAGCAQKLAAKTTPVVAPSKSHGVPPGERGAKAMASTPPRVRRRLQAAFKKGPAAFSKALRSETLPRDVRDRLAALLA